MDNLTKNKIQKLIESNPVMVFMKGTKLMPQCGFSNNVVQILNSLGVEFGIFFVIKLITFAFVIIIKLFNPYKWFQQIQVLLRSHRLLYLLGY